MDTPETTSKSREKVLTFEELRGLRERLPGKKIVQCHGVYDVLHAGHLSYFHSAKQFGDILVVTITADQFVNKGPGRPYFTAKVRASMIAALQDIDFVAISDYPTAVPSIEALQPHYYVKGPDYRDKSKDVTGGIYAEEAAAQRHGGELKFTEDETFSSSSLINRFFINWSEDQQKTIARVQELGGEAAISKVLDRVSQQKILVVGEPIIDTYRFCMPENISSKSPSISARFLYEENYAGGALAIANHLADFCKEIHLLITHGNEPFFRNLLKEKMDERIKLHEYPIPSVPTPRKTRYIAVDKAQRIFEITDLRSDQWSANSALDFSKNMVQLCRGVDGVVLADFGHGLFEGAVLNATQDIQNPFIALNVQTNSSNYGFNIFRKHKRFNYLSMDTKEARIAYHDRYSAPIDIGRRARKDLAAMGASVAMTLGSNGSYVFPGGAETEHSSPAFADQVVDATGAGDAFFCLTACLIKAECPPDLVPFVGNVFAGLKTKIIGNKSAVSKAQLIKAIGSILK